MNTDVDAPSHDSLLAKVLDTYLSACRRGNGPDPSRLIAEHPEIAGDLRTCLASLDFLQHAGQESSLPDSGAALDAAASDSALPSAPTLGDYRILRLIGRGGMGIVYEAEQISLRRHVALKVLPTAAMLDPRALQRFRNEAQAAAALHHSQIVPIYAVGCERGVHYYAMQFIDGLTLAEVITGLREAAGLAPLYQPDVVVSETSPNIEDENKKTESFTSPDVTPQPPADHSAAETVVLAALSTKSNRNSIHWFRRIAEQFAQVADALHHAHEVGVTHRDIKPANLMLDRLGHIWITDFGLARMEGEVNLTMTGDLLGTLRYMSPEQALGKRISTDYRTDIYSLGVTLYELLTLQPAFPGHGRQELLRQITHEEPKQPRKLNASIPRDLETIVLKSIEKNPAERYQTAADLAADLKRFVDDRHIMARRPSVYSRTLKWSRRNVEWVISVSLVAVVMLVATTLVTFIAAARERERSAERLRLNQEVGDELRQSLSLAQSANSAIGNDRLLWSQAREHAQRAAALATNERVDPTLRKEVSRVVIELDERQRDWALLAAIDRAWLVQLETEVGEAPARDKVVPIFVEALAGFGIEMSRSTPEVAARIIVSRPHDVKLAIITMLDELLYYPDDNRNSWIEKVLALADKSVWRATKRMANKISTPADRLAALQKLAAAKEADDQPTMLIAHLGVELHILGDNSSAIAVMRKAANRSPGDAQINHYLGSVYAKTSPPQFSEAARYATAAAALQPNNPLLIAELGFYLEQAGMAAEAVERLREGLRLKPDSARLHMLLGNALMAQRKSDEALAAYDAASRLQPDSARAHMNRGNALSRLGKHDEAVTALREGIRINPEDALGHYNLGVALQRQRSFREAIAEYRESIRLQPSFAPAHVNLGRLLQQEGKVEDAIEEFREAIRVEPTLVVAHIHHGDALRVQGRFEEAVAAFRAAIRLNPQYAPAHNALGNALWRHGKRDEAMAAYREAIRLQPTYASAHYNLGNALGMEGQLKEAVAACREAIRHEPDFALAHTKLAELERLLTLDAEFDDVLKGSNKPLTPNRRIEMAEFAAIQRRLPATAVKWYAQAFEEEPSIAKDLWSGHRYNAACAAALASTGRGRDAGDATAAERATLCRQALDWLRADVEARRELLAGDDPAQHEAVRKHFSHALKDPDFQSVRDELLLNITDESQVDWRKLWDNIAQTLTNPKGF